MKKLYLQYGCGTSCPEGWLNFDASPRMRFESFPVVGWLSASIGKRLFPPQVKYGDIVRGLPVAENSIQAVYASHVLEHLSREDVVTALTNTMRILKPGGIFRMIVPDLEWRARAYLAAVENGESDAADAFIKALHLGRLTRPRHIIGRLRSMLGNSSHLWMYDVRQMSKLLDDIGFVDIRRCTFEDSDDVMFSRVEDEGRFIQHGQHEVALESRKPE